MRHKTGFTSVFLRLSASLLAVLLAGCATGQNEATDECLRRTAIEQRRSLAMALKNHSANTQELSQFVQSLLNEDTGNLELLLDVVLPDNALLTQSSPDTISQLSARLSSENYSEVRKAIIQLYSLGPGAATRLKAEQEATTDPLAAVFLAGIVSWWQIAALDNETSRQVQYLLSKRIEAITDIPTILRLQKRAITVLSLERRKTCELPVVYAILQASVRTQNDSIVNQLAPLLDHPDVSISVMVVNAVGEVRNNRFFPALLITALRSERPQIVEEAIRWTPNCWDKAKKQEVHSCLEEIFYSQNEALKFHTCFPLMHDYEDREAVAYLLSQTQSKDRNRAETAIYWIGDACNSGDAAYPELLECLVPLLKSEDKKLRRAASYALGTYSGEAVITNLIPMLGDDEQIISSEARYKLLRQGNKDMLWRLLSEAAQSTTNGVVAAKAEDLLREMDERHRKPNTPPSDASYD